MQAHRVEVTLEQDGTLTLSDLPFRAGDSVEIFVLATGPVAEQRYSLRGTPLRYDNPFEPVALDTWDAIR